MTAELFEKESHATGTTLITKIAKPIQFCMAAPGLAFTARD
jgi:hypothetical protein